MAERTVPEDEKGYPEPYKLGNISASGFYVRHVRNIEFTNVELAWSQADARPVFRLIDVDGAEFFRIKTPKALTVPVFALDQVQDFSVSLSRNVKDTRLDRVGKQQI
jgi:hypothetical protein